MVQGISSALTALQVLGKKIGITANNIANANTPGFKKSRAVSQDLTPAGEGANQIGRGTALGEISESLSQGALIPTESVTDLAIGGEGFFIVRDPGGGSYYTRDGHFDFDNDGRLVDGSGNVLQGWTVDPESGGAEGAIGDISLGNLISAPQATTMISASVNLNADAIDNAPGTDALSGLWDGDNASGDYLPAGAYEYSTSIGVHDALGTEHNVALYFDRSGSGNDWEYIVTVNPAEDSRSGAGGNDLGLLARGTLSFDSAGTLTDMRMAANDGAGNWTALDPATDVTDGYFTFQADFQGGNAQDIRLDLGARYDGSTWAPESGGSTQYSAASTTVRSGSDGYGPGDLLSVSVNPDGVVTGNYSNGNVRDLFQIAVARFPNAEGLNKAGNNLYAATRESGAALTGTAGSNGLGRIVPRSLEESNVDLAEEMTNMIVFQRSYQANLKVLEMENELKGDVLNIIS